MRASISASAIRGSFIDEATKRALLGSGNSFGLPMSTGTSFKLSALDEGPVVLVPPSADRMILPFQVICGASEELPADVSAMLGWPNPDPEGSPTEHDEPWLGGPTTIAYGGEAQGSLVLLPNTGAVPIARLWPECLMGRAFAVSTEAPAARKGKKRGHKETDEEFALRQEREASERAGEAPIAPEPELSIVVFYTVF